jgi:hypothetical protein
MQLLTISQLANASGWPVSRIRRLIRKRQLVHLRVDSRTLLPADAIEEFMRENMIKPGAFPDE